MAAAGTVNCQVSTAKYSLLNGFSTVNLFSITLFILAKC